eukprot:GEMP01062460.1.p1 GENE.GEMP01062460.1~~GEMP01062460.1.p1  ORF type:complete len:151 (+),score=17.73 GEMP01062460.1:165-617(+)
MQRSRTVDSPCVALCYAKPRNANSTQPIKSAPSRRPAPGHRGPTRQIKISHPRRKSTAEMDLRMAEFQDRYPGLRHLEVDTNILWKTQLQKVELREKPEQDESGWDDPLIAQRARVCLMKDQARTQTVAPKFVNLNGVGPSAFTPYRHNA